MKRTLKTIDNTKVVEWMPTTWNGHIIWFMHGLGERGTDITKVEQEGLPRLLKEGLELNYIVIYTQLPSSATSWGKTILTKMVNILKKYQAKAYHVTGLSLGAMGSLSVMKLFPGFFKTAGICCGKTSDPSVTSPFIPTQLKFWHGTKDNVLPISNIRTLYKNLLTAGAKAQMVEYNDGHDIWDKVYNPNNSNGYWPWLNNRTASDPIVSQVVENGLITITTQAGKTYSNPVSL